MKNNTSELKKQLSYFLKQKCDKTFFEEAENTPYPYIVFEFQELGEESGKTKYRLEINCVDKGVSTKPVEDLADSIQDLFDHFSYENEKISFYMYRGQRNTVREEDKKIKRRRLTFELNLYSKEE